MNVIDIREIYRLIAIGKGHHGSFLVAFAEAVIRADHENFQLLKPVAEELITKYDLHFLINPDPGDQI